MDYKMKVQTTIEPAGDYVKYQNKKFFQDFHQVPTIEAPLFRGDGTEDESIDEDAVKSLRPSKKKSKNQKSLLQRELEKSSINYDQIRHDVIIRLHELGLVNSQKRRVQIKTARSKKSSNSSKRSEKLDPCSFTENSKKDESLQIDQRGMGAERPIRFLIRLGKGLTDTFSRPFKKPVKYRIRPTIEVKD